MTKQNYRNEQDRHLNEKQFSGNYPKKEEYKLFHENVSKKQTPGKILKKKRLDSQTIKVAKKWNSFWPVIEDFQPIFETTDEKSIIKYVTTAKNCFVCGYYIHPNQRMEPEVKKPYKKGDLCHVLCFNKNIKMDDVTKLNPESQLICHIEVPTDTNQILCRKRVFNNPVSLLQHWAEHENQEIDFKKIEKFDDYWLNNMGMSWREFRNRNFLKPTGEPFRH